MMKLSYTILSRLVQVEQVVYLTRTVRHGMKYKVGRCSIQHRGLATSDTPGDQRDKSNEVSEQAEGQGSNDVLDLKMTEVGKEMLPKLNNEITTEAEEISKEGSEDKEETKGQKTSVKEGKTLSRKSKSTPKTEADESSTETSTEKDEAKGKKTSLKEEKTSSRKSSVKETKVSSKTSKSAADKADKKGAKSKPEKVAPGSLRKHEVEELLGEFKLKYVDGYTCYIVNCLKFPINKRPIADTAIYINKTTGYFTCFNCNKRGMWSDLQKNFEAISKATIKGKFVCFNDPTADTGEVHDSLKNEEYVKNSLSKGVLLNDVTDKPFSDIQKEFGFHNILKSIMIKNTITYDAKTKSLLIPYRNPDLELTNCKQIQLDEDSEITQSFKIKGEPVSLFGWREGDKEKTKLVLTLTEKDALAVQQSTSDHCVLSVPKESQLPMEALPYLERFKSVVLWFGCDMKAWLVTKQFARKLGVERCLLFRPTDSCPAPFEALQQKKSLDLMLNKAKPIKHEFITSFSEIREDVLSELSQHEQVSGIKYNSIFEVEYQLKMKNLENKNDWTLTEADVQRGYNDDNYRMLEANMLAIKRQEKEFLNECEELRQQFKHILTTAGINQSQFPVTPNRNFAPSDPMTPTFMCAPNGLTNLDIHKCLLINTLNDSGCHGDRLTSDGCSDDEHSPMSTDTELSDFEDDTVFLERKVEGCETPELDNVDESLHFSTSFVAGHMADRQMRKKSHDSPKNQGTNPLASSTMMADKEEPVHKKRKPVQRGVSMPKGSSTLLYKPYPERNVNKSFSPVVKIKDLPVRRTDEDIVSSNTNNTGSIFTWSLQHSSSDVPLEESYLRSVKKRCGKPPRPTRQSSHTNTHRMSSKPNLYANETVYGLSVIEEKSACKGNIIVNDCLSNNDTLYCKTNTIPRSSTMADLHKTNNVQSVQKEGTHGGPTEGIFKKPSISSKDTKASVERKNSVVKKLMRFRESFKRKNGANDLRTLASL